MLSHRPCQNHRVRPVLTADHVLGSATASIIILEYGCYCSPREKQVFAAVSAATKMFGDQVAFVFRHYPLVATYPTAFLAAEAAEAAAAQGQFWQMHRYLADHACPYRRHDLIQAATELELDVPAFVHDLDTHVYAELVKGHFHSGVGSNLRRVPAVFVNGVRCEESITLEQLRRVVKGVGAAA